MKSYLYTPFELALIIQHHALDCNKYMDLVFIRMTSPFFSLSIATIRKNCFWM